MYAKQLDPLIELFNRAIKNGYTCATDTLNKKKNYFDSLKGQKKDL